MAKKRLFCLLLCALLLLLAGCNTAPTDWESLQQSADMYGDALEDPQLRQDATAMLDLIIAGEEEKSYEMVKDVITREDFQAPYDLMREHLKTVTAYELRAAYKSTRVQDGADVVSIRFLMTAGEERFLVEAARSEEFTGLAGFYLSPYVELQQNGTLGTMENADWMQWAFLVAGCLEMVFVVIVLVDCCRHKMEKKWLWILLILAGSLSVLLMATDNGLKVNYNYGLFFSHTALIRYSTGGFMLRLYLPAGAIAYAALRKKLFATYAELHPSYEEPIQGPSDPAEAPSQEENL